MDFFKDYQPVSFKIIKKDGGAPFSFVYFPSESLRDAAIEGKKGGQINGVDVVVNRSFNAFEGPRIGGKERFDPEFGECGGFVKY